MRDVRLGITASRKVGNSVVRHRLKRRVREVFRRFEGRDSMSVFDYPERDFAELVEIAADAPAALCSIMHSPVNDILQALAILRRYW